MEEIKVKPNLFWKSLPNMKYRSLLDGRTHLWSMSIDPIFQPWSRYVERCRTYLSASEQQRVALSKFERLQTSFIVSHGVLRLLLSGYLGKPPQSIEIGRHKKGKPFAADDPLLHFSMSHSGSKCVYAFSYGGEVGIDIEQIRELPDLDELIRRNFTPGEAAYILKSKGGKLRNFFQFWTIKEAYLKATGEGMRLTPDNLEFSIGNGQIKLISVNGVFEEEQWLFTRFSISNDCVGTLAYQGDKVRNPALAITRAA